MVGQSAKTHGIVFGVILVINFLRYNQSRAGVGKKLELVRCRSKTGIGAGQEQRRSRAGALYLIWPISALMQDFMGRSRSWEGAGAEPEQEQEQGESKADAG